eukprot:Rmarinus@m.10410
MSEELVDVGSLKLQSDVHDAVKKLARSHSAANEGIVLSIDPNTNVVSIDAHEKEVDFEEFCEDNVPETSPRYIIYSYKWERDDGRVQYPMCFIYYNPEGCRPNLNIIYSRHATQLQNYLDIHKLFTVQNSESLTEDWLKQQLKAQATR